MIQTLLLSVLTAGVPFTIDTLVSTLITSVTGNGCPSALLALLFDDHHTSSNIYQKIQYALSDWNLSSKVKLCLRDNAANVAAAFEEPGCTFESAGCLNHLPQLAIKDEFLSLPSVQALVEKCCKVCSHASSPPLLH